MSKAKKMTMKRFKEVVNEVYPFDVYGWEGLLAVLERKNWDEAKVHEAKGEMAKCYDCRCSASKLHSALEEIGYYENV